MPQNHEISPPKDDLTPKTRLTDEQIAEFSKSTDPTTLTVLKAYRLLVLDAQWDEQVIKYYKKEVDDLMYIVRTLHEALAQQAAS